MKAALPSPTCGCSSPTVPRLYADPITKSTDWGLVRTADHRIAGVYSRSEIAPRKTDRFPPEWVDFSGKERYSDWRFVALRVFQDDLRRRPAAASAAASSEAPGAPTMPAAPTVTGSPMPPQPQVSAFPSEDSPAAAPPQRPPIVTLPRPPRWRAFLEQGRR